MVSLKIIKPGMIISTGPRVPSARATGLSLRRAAPPPNLSARVSAAASTFSASATVIRGAISRRLRKFLLGIASVITNNAPPARPLVVGAAAGMARWIEVYCGVLMLRVLLGWFPNLPWDKQPFSAIRDLSDPYLSLFRNVVPPIFGGSLDVSPLLAFAVLGVLASLLNAGARRVDDHTLE